MQLETGGDDHHNHRSHRVARQERRPDVHEVHTLPPGVSLRHVLSLLADQSSVGVAFKVKQLAASDGGGTVEQPQQLPRVGREQEGHLFAH